MTCIEVTLLKLVKNKNLRYWLEKKFKMIIIVFLFFIIITFAHYYEYRYFVFH